MRRNEECDDYVDVEGRTLFRPNARARLLEILLLLLQAEEWGKTAACDITDGVVERLAEARASARNEIEEEGHTTSRVTSCQLPRVFSYPLRSSFQSSTLRLPRISHVELSRTKSTFLLFHTRRYI